ncbi:MAG: hypothetical protein EBU90_31500 [Proteobacteria bacterium]|nr:hypothetical protein [Pseudomonadota bacterium]
MREFKFRVWNGVGWVVPDDFALSDLMHNTDDYTYQQYTGLSDKNGKDIYEGDVLRVKEYDDWDDQVGFYINKVVVFKLGKFVVQIGAEDSDFIGIDLLYYIPVTQPGSECEVIGNIFENPELIKRYEETL